MASASSSAGQGNLSPQEIASMFNSMRAEQQAREAKISELDGDKHEHRSETVIGNPTANTADGSIFSLVIESLEPLDPARKCYRLINGVLVERTVGEVVPALKATREGINQVIKQLTEQYRAKEKELAEFQQKYNIQIRGEMQASQRTEKKSASQGVLA